MNQNADKAKQALTDTRVAIEAMHADLLRNEIAINDLRRRSDDAERRARQATEVAAEHLAKANRTDDLEDAIQPVLDTFARLPLKMEDAGLVQTVVPPAIPLYGTHEWQALATAMNRLTAVLGRKEKSAAE